MSARALQEDVALSDELIALALERMSILFFCGPMEHIHISARERVASRSGSGLLLPDGVDSYSLSANDSAPRAQSVSRVKGSSTVTQVRITIPMLAFGRLTKEHFDQASLFDPLITRFREITEKFENKSRESFLRYGHEGLDFMITLWRKNRSRLMQYSCMADPGEWFFERDKDRRIVSAAFHTHASSRDESALKGCHRAFDTLGLVSARKVESDGGVDFVFNHPDQILSIMRTFPSLKPENRHYLDEIRSRYQPIYNNNSSGQVCR